MISEKDAKAKEAAITLAADLHVKVSELDPLYQIHMHALALAITDCALQHKPIQITNAVDTHLLAMLASFAHVALVASDALPGMEALVARIAKRAERGPEHGTV